MKWREQYERMKRWRSRLNETHHDDEQRRDDFYAFFVCCYHLKDWIKSDDSLDKQVRQAMEPFIAGSSALELAGDLTNGFKHLKREPGAARTDPSAHVSVVSGSQLDECAFDAAQFGGFVIAGTTTWENAYDVADRCIADWDRFLRGECLLT